MEIGKRRSTEFWVPQHSEGKVRRHGKGVCRVAPEEVSWKSGSGGHRSLTMGLGDCNYRQLFASMGNGEMGSSWKEMWVK